MVWLFRLQSNQPDIYEARGVKKVLKDTIRWLLFLGNTKPEIAEQISSKFPPDTDW